MRSVFDLSVIAMINKIKVCRLTLYHVPYMLILKGLAYYFTLEVNAGRDFPVTADSSTFDQSPALQPFPARIVKK